VSHEELRAAVAKGRRDGDGRRAAARRGGLRLVEAAAIDEHECAAPGFPQLPPAQPTGCARLCFAAARAVASRSDGRSVPRRAVDTAASILVVDDDSDIREALAEVLNDGGTRVATARDGYEALEKLECLERPCLILLDMMMPRMSGLEFLEHLSRQPDLEGVAVVVMSAHDGLRREAERHSTVRATLQKPFDFDALLCLFDEGRGERSPARVSSAVQ
jgi:CheY-like chemotaxis protein